MAGPRIGSLFTGTGALDLAVTDVFGGETVWHSQYEPPDKKGRPDTNQYAAKILARHWPTTPNLGDITAIDWQAVLDEHGPIDILTGGFPCQDVSSAGKRAGLNPDSRSGLWAHMSHAISVLRPRLVVIENVEGLLSAEADRGLGLDAEALEVEARAGRVLRALGAVLGDLATLGFDAEWARVAASEVGAPHGRKRVFIYAWPADADPADLGHQWGRGARRRGHGPADGRQAAADSECVRRQGQWCDAGTQPRWEASPSVGRGSTGSSAASADSDGRGREGHQERDRGAEDGQPERERRLDAVGRGVQRATDEPACPTCGCEESFHDAGGFCAGCHGCTDPELGRPDEAAADAEGVGHGPRRLPVREGAAIANARVGREDAADTDHSGRRADVLNLRPGQPDLDWGDYEAAIRRWEHVLGRPVPWPTDALGRLSPVFTEWLMGLPAGWVTETPGLTRSAMLRALGNGVVRRQAEAALRLLSERAGVPAAAAAA